MKTISFITLCLCISTSGIGSFGHRWKKRYPTGINGDIKSINVKKVGDSIIGSVL